MSLTLSEAHKILEAEGLAFVDFGNWCPADFYDEEGYQYLHVFKRGSQLYLTLCSQDGDLDTREITVRTAEELMWAVDCYKKSVDAVFLHSSVINSCGQDEVGAAQQSNIIDFNSFKGRVKNKHAYQIVVGRKSYKEQIEESKRKIHLLDSLQPKNEEEAREQEETLRYLEEHLD